MCVHTYAIQGPDAKRLVASVWTFCCLWLDSVPLMTYTNVALTKKAQIQGRRRPSTMVSAGSPIGLDSGR